MFRGNNADYHDIYHQVSRFCFCWAPSIDYPGIKSYFSHPFSCIGMRCWGRRSTRQDIESTSSGLQLPIPSGGTGLVWPRPECVEQGDGGTGGAEEGPLKGTC